jgi:hypothetical protein
VFNAVYPYVLVFATGLLGIWKAVPVGFAFGLGLLWTWFLTAAGSSVAAVVIHLSGTRIREYLERRRKKPFKQKASSRARKLMDRYGTPGLGFFGSLLMGPNLTMLLGLAIVSSPRKLLGWTLVGIVVWTFALSLTASLGIDLFQKL